MRLGGWEGHFERQTRVEISKVEPSVARTSKLLRTCQFATWHRILRDPLLFLFLVVSWYQKLHRPCVYGGSHTNRFRVLPPQCNTVRVGPPIRVD